MSVDVSDHIGFAHHIARKYAPSAEGAGLPFEDLTQAAAVGLCEAAARFDPDRGFTFTTFARHYVSNQCREGLPVSWWLSWFRRL